MIQTPTKTIELTKIGRNTKIWDFVNIYNSDIGDNCSIGHFCNIGGAEIGDDARIGSGTFIPDGVSIGEDAFIGPNVTFTNDKTPTTNRDYREKFEPQKTRVGVGAVIGAGTTILPGITIGNYAIIGAGSVVTRNVPANEVWFGCPAKKQRTIKM